MPTARLSSTVEDCGPGIEPRTAAEDIFEAFITTKPHGMGLGLAICRMIVERHDGKLGVAPAQPSGSAFSVDLARRRALTLQAGGAGDLGPAGEFAAE